MDHYKPLEQFRALVYGRFKTGKTEGAATMPRPNFISFDQGMATVASPGFRLRHPSVKLSEIIYQDFYETKRDKNGIITAHEAFDHACIYFDAWQNPKGAEWKNPYTGEVVKCSSDAFDTWVLDSGTTLSQAAMNKGVMVMGDMKLSQTYSTGKAKGLIVPKQQDFGAERSMLEQFIRMLYDSGKHVIILAHEKEIYNDAGAITEIVPLFTGQSVERVSLMFDEVLRLRMRKQGTEMKRELQAQTDGIVKCGTRSGIPDGTPWTWDAIRSALRGS